MLRRSSVGRCERGAVFIEFAAVIVLVAALILLICDFGLLLFRYGRLSHTTETLTRELSTRLGMAWSTGTIGSSPWNGSCNAFLRDAGSRILAGFPETYSMSNSSADFYFGETMDHSHALISDPRAPYPILRVIGTLRSRGYLTPYLPAGALTADRSALVEYSIVACNDY